MAKSTTTLTTRTGSKPHKIVSAPQWLAARKKLLAAEKKFTRLRDQLSRQRRNLPWEKVEKDYVFDGPKGQETLAELFDGRSQLIVYHFMFDPDDEEGCAHCSFWADHYDGPGAHLNQRDTTFVVVSHAPSKKLSAFKKRMGWHFKWVSSGQTDFNYDYHVSFTPEELQRGPVFYNYAKSAMGIADREGVSAFYKDRSGAVFHTYSAHARGIDLLNTTYNFLDLTAKGRDENPEQTQDWVDYHDKYPARG
jgi:predicted dithiol-disulfide oxidoreductase (DUF899 family)